MPRLLLAEEGRANIWDNVVTGSLERFKASAFLVLVGAYLVLNYPFMQFVVGELFLVLVLLGTNVPRVLSRMGVIAPLLPFLLWWSWAVGHLMFDTVTEGYWALRDATHLLDSLFVIVGFTLAGNPQTVARLAYWLRPIVVTCILYALSIGYGYEIAEVAPTISGVAGRDIPIFGVYAIPSTVLLWGAIFCVIQPACNAMSRLRYVLLAAFLVAFALIVVQARTTYLQLLAVGMLLVMLRPRALSGLGVSVPLFFAALLVMSAFDLRVAGRLTSEFSLSFFWDHIQSVVGIYDEDHAVVASAAHGVSQRLGWWDRIYDQLTRDEVTLLTGLGYGIPLTDFSDAQGVVTREPHNSLISVTGRLGLIGVFAWLWMQVTLFRAGYRAYFDCLHAGRQQGADLIFVLMAFAVLTLVSCLGEDAMEKPYNAIPYYAFWGFVLRIGYEARARVPVELDRRTLGFTRSARTS
jgi:hypothetical protein